MAKQRKTRKDKQQADRRHPKVTQTQAVTSTTPPQAGVYSYAPQTTVSAPVVEKRKNQQPSHQNTTTSIIYQYATQDIRKTAFITCAIVLGQIVVYIIGVHGKLL